MTNKTTAPLDILGKLESGIASFPKSQRRVAAYILKDPMQAAFSTVEEIAHAASTSTTTVVRLAMTVEFAGFADLQKNLQEYLQNRASPSTKLAVNIRGGEERLDMVADAVRLQLANIDTTCKNLNDEAILRTAKALGNARNIYVHGQRSCYGVAHYMAYNIDRVLGNCNFIANTGGGIPEILHRIGEGDVMIVLSMPRYIRQVVRLAQQAKNRGAFVAAFSDGFASPFVSNADVMLMAEGKSTDFHNAMTSFMFLADVLISVVAAGNRDRAKANLADTEKILRELDIHMR